MYNKYTPFSGNKKQLSLPKVLEKVVKYCAYQERCVADVEDKLLGFELTDKEKDQIIDYLIEERFLDEERFVNSYVRGKFRLKKWGKIRIVNSLRQKKIKAELIETALNQINEEEYLDTLQKLLIDKYNSLDKSDTLKTKAALVRYVQYKGYEYELILSQIDQLLKA